jgi:hypothetical protein
VVPRAAHLYLSGPLQGPSSRSTGSDDEGEEEAFEMVSGEGGSPEALPLPARRVLHALQHLQRRMDEMVGGRWWAQWG